MAATMTAAASIVKGISALHIENKSDSQFNQFSILDQAESIVLDEPEDIDFLAEEPVQRSDPGFARLSSKKIDYTKILPVESFNPCLKVTAQKTIKLSTSPVREPAHDEVLLHIKCTGVCGSDIHFWHNGGIGPLRVLSDCILGHEASGQVLRVGSSVKNLVPGDRVAIEPGVPCGECFLCKDGRYNLCEAVAFSGVWPFEGTLQRFKCHPARWVHKMPDNLTWSQGALLEPLSVVMHGIQETGLALGKGCAIHGAGPIG